jgi:alpha-galactosidase
MNLRLALTAVTTVLVLLLTSDIRAGEDQVAQLEDAYVSVDQDAGVWTIGNRNIRFSIKVDRSGSLSLDGLFLGDGTAVTQGHDPDGLVTLDGRTTGLGVRDSSLMVESVTVSGGQSGVELLVHMRQPQGPLAVVRHYKVYPDTPVVELWTSFAGSPAQPITTRNINAYELTVRAGAIRWLNGLDMTDEDGGPFVDRGRELGNGGVLDLGSETVSSATTVPYFSVEDDGVRFFSGLAWSGSWSTHFERIGNGLRATVGLPNMSAMVSNGVPFDGPHALVGATRAFPGADTAAIAAALRASRGGRPYPSLTAFNTWFVYGTRISQSLVQQAMFYAERADIELFQVDAGWYPHLPTDDVFNFTSGLGSWTVDEARFPDGLGSLGDYSRLHGMKFGVWVEPERVALTTVNKPGLAKESFLATTDGRYDPGLANNEGVDGQICLGNPEAMEWVWEKIVRFVDAVRPDQLKWDYNRFMICNRPGHGHPVDGGNFAHVRGLYELMRRLRSQYPSLSIENVSGGGRRLDLAMAQLTDMGWMDDRTAPARHVRNNLQGLTKIFPAPYLFSYLINREDEPIKDTSDVSLYGRSRMIGTFGVSVNFDEISSYAFGLLNQQVKQATSLRKIQADAVTITLTPPAIQEPPWDIVQQISVSTGRGLLFAFETRPGGPTRARLQRLGRNELYEVQSIDSGVVGRFSGAYLADEGLYIEPNPYSASQVFTIEPVSVTARRPSP